MAKDIGWTMRLSFFPDGSPDCPLLMLSDLTVDDFVALREAARDLANGRRDVASFSLDPGSDAQLVFRVADRSVGIRRSPPAFECLLRTTQWLNVEGLIEPFLSGAVGYQWLDDSGEVALLLSTTGEW